MSAHTPGPWLVNPFVARVDNGLDSPICELLWPTSLRSEDETEANGRLIAAAPELLEALKAICDEYVDDLPDVSHDLDLPRHHVIAGRKLIAKAEGK